MRKARSSAKARAPEIGGGGGNPKEGETATAPGLARNLSANASKALEITFKADAPANTGTKKGGASVTNAELKYWLYYAKVADSISDATTADDVVAAVGDLTDDSDKTKGRIEALATNLAAGFKLDGLTAGDTYRYTVVVIHPDGTTNSDPAKAKTSEAVRLADSKATAPDSVPKPTVTADTGKKDGFTVTWDNADIATAKKDDDTPLQQGDVSYVVYYTSVTTKPADKEAVRTAGSGDTLTSGNVPVAKGTTKTASPSGKAFVHTVYIVVEAINTTDPSKTKLSAITEYAVTDAQTPPDVPKINSVTPGETKFTVNVTPLTEGNFGTADNGVPLKASDLTYIFFYAKKGVAFDVDGTSTKVEEAGVTSKHMYTALKGLANDGSDNTANKGRVVLTAGTDKKVPNLTPDSDYYYTVRVQETADETNGVNTAKAKASTLAIISPTSFTLHESDFNDGYISRTSAIAAAFTDIIHIFFGAKTTKHASAVVTLLDGSFKGAGDAAWKAPLPIAGTAVPIGLTPKVKRISSTKVQIIFTGTATNHATANNAKGVKLNLKSLVDGSRATDILVTFGVTFINKSPDDLIRIYNARELQKVNEHPTLSFVLANDIDLTGVTWTPIGRVKDKEFSGTFDGKGKTIRNLKIGSKAKDAGNYTGLFGRTKAATIKNLIIDHAGIWGGNKVGALVGTATNTTITGVGMRSTGNAAVIGVTHVGGLVGTATNTTITGVGMRSTGNAAVIGVTHVGGLVGNASNSIVNGYATGDVRRMYRRWNAGENFGGLVGDASSSTVNGYATGNVRGENPVGGLVGNASNSIVNGYATGTVTGEFNRVGGLVGNASSSTVNGYARGTVVYAAPPSASTDFGLLVGKRSGGSLTGFHSSTESVFKDIASEEATGEDGTAVTIATANQTTFAGFTFGSKVGEWTWVADGQWPAINLPADVGGASAAADQPTE